MILTTLVFGTGGPNEMTLVGPIVASLLAIGLGVVRHSVSRQLIGRVSSSDCYSYDDGFENVPTRPT